LQTANGCVLVSFVKPITPPSCAKRIFDIAEALCLAVGNAIRPGLIPAVMALLVVRRIQRVRGLLLALEARFLAGRLPAGGRPVGSADKVARRIAVAGNIGPELAWTMSLPRRFGWLCGLVPGDPACFAGQLRVVLAEPGMVALLAACPQAVRIVRPLCWMLGIAAADYVPSGEVALKASAAAILVRAAEPAPVVSEGVEAGHLAARMSGLGWVRFIPG
jgi:hypothetical protein